jgi:chemotaxis protein methyltransferase CheR
MSPFEPKIQVPEAIEGQDFDYIRTLVRDHTAITLDRSKVYLVNARLLPIAREVGLDSVVPLLRRLRSSPFGDLHTRAVEAIVTTETSFYRDFFPFEALRGEIIPELIARRRARDRCLAIWSAGCSSGQEPYSFAMMIRDAFPELAGWNVRIYASDVSNAMLERSRAGIYSQNEVNRGLPAAALVRHFRQLGASWQLKDDIRGMVTFFRHNLARDTPALPPIDILMMRNVLIYFDVETKREVLDRVRRQLRRGGLLMLGTAETTLNLDERFQRQRTGRSVFYRNGDAEGR